MEYQTSGNLVQGSIGIDSDIQEKLIEAYGALCDAEDAMDSVEKEIGESLPENIEPCDALKLSEKLNELAQKIVSIKEGMESAVSIALSGSVSVSGGINVQLGMEKYVAFGLIMKKFELLKLKCEKLKCVIEKFVLKITKNVLTGMLSGKGSTMSAPVNAANSALGVLGTACNAILTVLGTILTLINNLTIMNVNGAGCCFFMTPKSLKKTEITIANVNLSVTNNIPEPVDQAITVAEESIKEANGVIKKGKVAACAAAGRVSAATGNFIPTSFGKLEPFKPETIRTAVNAILQLVVDADALPRYEKLSTTNIRFLAYLVTGFEPSAKQSFGIPGFP